MKMWIWMISVFPYLWLEMVYGRGRIQLIPHYPTINGSVTLNVMGITENIGDFTWYNGSKPELPNRILRFLSPNSPIILKGPLYNDRFSVFNNGSLQIKQLLITDGGNYTVQIKKTSENLTVSLIVYELVTNPRIIAFTTLPKENEVFALICTTVHAMTIRWTRNDSGIPSGSKLFRDNKTLAFSSVKREDAGEYRCEAQNLVSTSTSDPYTLTVAYGPDMVHINGRLNVSSGSSITLTCSADSVPPPEYQWKLNGSDLQEKTSKYDISNAAPEDEGLYTCVVRNPVTLGTATDSSYVNVTADITIGSSGSSPIIIAGVVCGATLSVVVLFSVTYLLYRMHIIPLSEAQRGKQEQSEIYENMVDLPSEQMNDPFYMDLQYKAENVYTIIIR
ncbi:cell adhesion molecule CEACAM6-like [Phyllobates terribilis]|uniref:cell adhesion molecule CEACAM6-like n=1 Tax=Phyllobates terribilis TaxID=111132 RepID=UPI003CCB48AF